MRRRGTILFLILNAFVSAGAAFFALSLFSNNQGEPVENVVRFDVIITATQDPNYTPPVIIITSTLEPGRANIPDEVREGTPVTQAAVETIDPTLFNTSGQFAGSVDQLPTSCIQHTVAEGEFPSLIAENYGISMFTLLAVNGLDEETATLLQIGETLIVPLEGCPIELFVAPTATPITETPTESATPTLDVTQVSPTPATLSPTPTLTPSETSVPTLTLAPTASSAQVEIVEVRGAGDITTESVVILNNGSIVDISGWTLSDGTGNTYTIPDGKRLFTGGSITINTRAGEDTPILLFWGRDTAVFDSSGPEGEVIVLADRDGVVQASSRLPAR